MAEKTQTPQVKAAPKVAKVEKSEQPKKKPEEVHYESLVRIYGFDIPGSRNVYVGLTKIKGISWAVSNVLLSQLKIPKHTKASELSKDDIKRIEDALENPQMPDYMKNRRYDEETGKTEHIIGTDLDVKKDFDIKKMKKIKSFKGIRHTLKQPVRGQRTRSHFRAKGRTAVGVKKKVAA